MLSDEILYLSSPLLMLCSHHSKLNTTPVCHAHGIISSFFLKQTTYKSKRFDQSSIVMGMCLSARSSAKSRYDTYQLHEPSQKINIVDRLSKHLAKGTPKDALIAYFVQAMTTWAAAPEGKIVKSDVSIAKNYLSEKEMRSLDYHTPLQHQMVCQQDSRHLLLKHKNIHILLKIRMPCS